MLMGVDKCVGVCTCSQLARRFVLRDMGNGVDRIEMAELVHLEAAKEECLLPGRSPILLNSCGRLLDACSMASPPSFPCADCVQSGSVRSVDEYTIELIAWRRG